MKKTLYKLAIAAIAVVGLYGCNKYLDLKPLDSNSDSTNWTSESAIETYSWKFYGYLSELSYGSGWTRGQYHAEGLTDDYATDSFVEFTKTIPNSSGTWNTNYDRIREANIMLNRIDLVPDLSEKVANHWRGVARFFRALYHFNLVRTYGDVVWVEEEIDFSKEENVTRPRDSRVTVMDNIVADLEFAMNNCYDPSTAGVNTVNNMVAAALLSRVALYEGAWEKYHNVSGGHADTFYSKAKTAAAKVIDSNLYEVTDNYKGMYTSLSLVGSKEVLLYKIYTLANVNGGKITEAHSQYGWSDSSTPTWGLTKSAMENYTNDQGLPVHMFAYNDATMDGVFKNRDKRLTASVYDQIMPITELAWDFGIISTTGYWTFKFLPLERRAEMEANASWNGPSNDTDGPIFQYSEVLLNYAEACAELGQITQSDLDKSVNLLRVKHGGIPALTLAGTGVSVNGTAITKAPGDPAANVLLQELRRERRSELMCDGFRHDDLMRWALGENLDTKKNPDGYLGASVAALQSYAGSVTGAKTWAEISAKNFFLAGYKSPYNTAAVNAGGTTVDREWNDKYYLEPIPAGQILLDDKLTQNPGW
ncbi:MAG: RagB/SusD family nutrient uptake outer membrane protein [Bacteroidales bacterium]|nr:RagB/SusD family nutrient uptake outer membrane protein [Bacteroidales bacterium]